MYVDQLLILGILIATVGMFLWGRWRHDMVAAGALLACVMAGLVSPADAFYGFGHPAVITVACVLVLSRGLQMSGAVDVLTRLALPPKAGPTLAIAALTGLGAMLSAFMNNVGALALLMPVAMQIARRLDLPAGRVLMPLAFGSILGGMTTLIGTPTNLIVSAFRANTGAGTFGMFDFAPVGGAVAGAGVLFVALVGWRLVPGRKTAGIEGFDTAAYLTEARVPAGSKGVGKTLREIEKRLEQYDVQVVGLVRNGVHVNAPHPGRTVMAHDILVIEADADRLSSVLSTMGMTLEEAKPTGDTGNADEEYDAAPAGPEEQASKKSTTRPATAAAKSALSRLATPNAAGKGEDGRNGKDEKKPGTGKEIILQEMVVLPGSHMVGRTAHDLLLRTRYGINLLAVSRQGHRLMKRLRSHNFQAGDLLLLQGPPSAIAGFAADTGSVPLAERELTIHDSGKAITATLIMAAAIASAALGVLPPAVSFAAGVLASMALRTVPPRAVYDAIDWPVIVLLGMLIPVAGAMGTTGTADLIATALVENVARGHAVAGLALILVVSMMLTDLMNNAATAAVMCPVAIGTAAAVGANADAFLMAVAIGSSCAFLTPIGHQNNTLILGPGGFRFGDYWRLGLPIQLLVISVSIPMLLRVWPL
ncbi:MAG: SLC13 family permease [Pseudomonadota bacterium]|nr:SLC13 family permease [Pseudomonadota bacterium]